ncbi:MAG: fructosamine kinase family protein [Alphaproteobacteria bacterium]|nr:fructosamine kinase family protein [Alphaproteobacteria bacterium]
MRPDELLRRAGLPVSPCVPLAGGDTSEVHRCGPCVVKVHAGAPAGLFASEARGLRLLASHGVPVPEVLHVEEEGLVLAHVPTGPADPEALGRVIAAMHAVRGAAYGLEREVFLGPVRLPAGTGKDWRSLLWTRRIEPLLRLCHGRLGGLEARVEAVAARVPLPSEGPRLLHGDLWSGNVLHGAEGPVLLDPGAWWGERAVDLAMMALFGGFGGRCEAAYREALPVPAEVDAAVPFHQLPFLLVHVHLFGGSYVDGVRRVLARYG